MATWGSLKLDEAIPLNRQGFGQGYFRYYRPDNTFETIVAVNGKLIRDGGDLPITNLPDGFQTTRMIEAVQWKDRMFIATGTKLVEYDGITAKVVEEYKPKPLEALYIGTNGLAEFPDNFMQDGDGDILRVDGVVPSLRKGIMGETTTFSTFISKPPAMGAIEYKYEYKLANRDTFLLGKDWSTAKTWDWTPKDIGDYIIQVSAREVGSTVNPPAENPEVFQIPVYKVTAFNENEDIDTSQMHTCNRILLHWERLIVYGDIQNPRHIYISHLQNPRYFPTNNSLEFENNEQEPLQKLVQYRDFIVAFMPSTIQALYGKAPIGEDTYRRVVIHTGLGCIAPETPKVLGNHIAFLSKAGVHVLKSIGYTDEKMNVEKIDIAIDNLIPLDTDACAIVYNDQYQICFPRKLQRFRFYREWGVWAKDDSPMFDFCRMYEWNEELVGQSQVTGKTYQFDETLYKDVEFVYEARLATKAFDFDEPYNPKKLKEQQIIMTNESSDENVKIEVIGDGGDYIITYQEAEMVREVNEKQNTTKIPLAPEDKVRTVQTVVRHKEAEKFSLLGLAYIFKSKKP
jgi:hypothetical protein